jgi:hypothetical protein
MVCCRRIIKKGLRSSASYSDGGEKENINKKAINLGFVNLFNDDSTYSDLRSNEIAAGRWKWLLWWTLAVFWESEGSRLGEVWHCKVKWLSRIFKLNLINPQAISN